LPSMEGEWLRMTQRNVHFRLKEGYDVSRGGGVVVAFLGEVGLRQFRD